MRREGHLDGRQKWLASAAQKKLHAFVKALAGLGEVRVPAARKAEAEGFARRPYTRRVGRQELFQASRVRVDHVGSVHNISIHDCPEVLSASTVVLPDLVTRDHPRRGRSRQGEAFCTEAFMRMVIRH